MTDTGELRFEKRMSDSDALMWRIETDPVLRSTITSVAIYDRLSYVDECQVGINTDPAAVPDPEVLVSCLTDSFDETRKLA